jgi:predicted TIM-barrel fold metal-dependent hydrolase
MAITKLSFPVFDADNHLYEAREALTQFLPDRYRGAIDFAEVHGRTKIMVRGHVSDYIPNPTFDRVGRPGALAEYYQHGNAEGRSMKEMIGRGIDCPPAFREAGARLTLMDEQGIDYAMMYPTLASLVEERMRDDPDLSAAAIHALNQWMLEPWPYVYEDRIFCTPVITPGVVDKAVEELEFVLDHGARAILMRPAPAWGYRGPRSFALPEFDPYWALIEDSGVLVVIHASDTGYNRYVNEWQGTDTETLSFGQPSAFSVVTSSDGRAIRDAVTSLICHGTLWRFPKLRFALVENGGGWVPHLHDLLDHAFIKEPYLFEENPTETFKRHFWMHPFHEEDPKGLVELLGANRVVFGSDYPHVEGISDPLAWADELHGLPDDVLRQVMGGNMMDLLGLAVSG